MENGEVSKEYKMRLNVKQNFKKERSWDYTVKADTIGELKALKELVKVEAEKEVEGT